MSDNEIRIHPREPIAEGKTCLFEIRERFDSKAAYRKVYSDEQGRLYIMYKSKRYYKGDYKADTKNDIIFYMWFQDNCFSAMDNYFQPLDMTDRDWDYAISRYERLQGEEIIKLACNALGVDFGDLLQKKGGMIYESKTSHRKRHKGIYDRQ